MTLILDPKTTALVMIDLQNGIVARETAPHSPNEVVRNAVTLADTLRAKGGLIVWVHVLINEILKLPVDAPNPTPSSPPPASASQLVAALNLQPTDIVIAKRQWGAFYGTNLEQQLKRHSIKTIVLGGIATNFGVESTARAALDMGYELIFPEDAMTSMSGEAHEFVIKNIFPRMGRIRSTAEIVAALAS